MFCCFLTETRKKKIDKKRNKKKCRKEFYLLNIIFILFNSTINYKKYQFFEKRIIFSLILFIFNPKTDCLNIIELYNIKRI